tara:strand:+ start:68 stop:892 length:825 start_codon:yes stop_codon:yes gene_type:complete
MTTYAIHAAANINWQRGLAPIIKEGLSKHGVNATITSSSIKESDVSIILGPNFWKQVEAKGNYIMFNRKFLGFEPQDVHENVAISWDGFNGNGIFCVKDINPQRLNVYLNDEDILDWQKKPKGNLLLCEQSDLGRCTRWPSVNAWYENVKNNNWNVVVRKKINPSVIGEDLWLKETKKQIKNIKAAAVLNSTVSTELFTFGVPIISYDKGDPCYAVSNRVANGISYFSQSLRREFLTYLAHCQWHYDEIRNGQWWDVLKEKEGKRLNEWLEKEL